MDFREFVTSRSRQLLRSAYLLTGDRGSAEDLVQSVLLKTYLAWHKVVQADDPLAYTQRILYTTAVRARRRRRVVEEVGFLPDRVLVEPASSIEDRDHLGRALNTLPRKQRAVLVLRFFEDLSVETVADLMGCSVGTVKSQTSKALHKLRTSSLVEPSNEERPA